MEGSPIATLVTLFVGLLLLLADEWIRRHLDPHAPPGPDLEQRVANLERDLAWVPIIRQRMAELERAAEGISALLQRVADLERNLSEVTALQGSLQVQFNALNDRLEEGGDRAQV